MERAPPQFLAKYEQLKQIIDPSSTKSIADLLGEPQGFVVSSSGAHTFGFWGGLISSYDHTGRYPLVCIHGPIYSLYYKLSGVEGGFGRPITDVVDLADGSKCCITEGGHIHSWGDKAEPFPPEHCSAQYKPVAPTNPFGRGPGGMPASFHRRWVELSTIRHPTGRMIIEILGPVMSGIAQNTCGGQRFMFLGGELISVNNESLPYVMYGEIWKLWDRTGRENSGWGRPLTDEQELADGGRCSVMEGGHIHWDRSGARGARAELCTAQYKPTPRASVFNVMPPHFQRKWSLLAVEIHPVAQRSVVEIFSLPFSGLLDNPKKPGQYVQFFRGLLVSHDSNPNPAPMEIARPTVQAPPYHAPHLSAHMAASPPFPQPVLPNSSLELGNMAAANVTPLELIPPFAVYGAIFKYFESKGGLAGSYGRPLCDEQDLGDGGRCSIFEGGHIHLYNDEARGVPAENCTAPYQPRAPLPPLGGISPNPQYPPPGTAAPWPNVNLGHGAQHHESVYLATPPPQIPAPGQLHGQGYHQSNEGDMKPGGCWYCLTGIDLYKAPDDFGPYLVFCLTGLQPGQHSGYCCHGCCHVTV